MAHTPVVKAAVALVALIVAGTATACSEDRAAEDSSRTTSPDAAECREDLLACARETSIGDLVPDDPTEATGEPIVLGMMNQENTPVGSFPELSQATQAGIDFVNEQLGGVGGRPLELDVCNTEFSTEGSTACAQRFVQAEVPAVLGGIDVFGTGIETLADNDIPYLGGIPVSDQSVTNPISYQWSGGIWGASVAFAAHSARELGASRAAIVYGEFGPITQAAEFGRDTLEALGADEVQLIPHPIVSTDLTSPIQAAASNDPDVVFVLTADTGCKAAFDAVQTVGLEAQMFYVGACASPNIIAQATPEQTNGAIFNVEGEIDRDSPNPDTELYVAVVEEYGDGLDPIGAGTVTFRSFMNVYAVLRGLDEVTPAAIIESLQGQAETPSFMGHPYTCDGEQFEGLPGLCSPQQILAQIDEGELTQVGTWIDPGEEYPG